MPPSRLTVAGLYACFFLSGAAGLVYQTSWSQELALVLGASELAVATVLAAFMGGLALGAALAARWAQKVERPVLTYALLEVGIALSAALIRPGLTAVRVAQVGLLGGVEAGAAASLAFYLAASLGLLLVPTMLMGATLPLLTRPLVASDADLGHEVGTLYSVNTLGAALGALAGPFLLVPRLGLGGALWAAGGANLATAALAFVLAPRLAVGRTEPGEVSSAPAPRRVSWVLPALCATGVVSFTWEIVWTRLLTHLLGGSIYAFGTMLATYLLGLALGARLALPWARETAAAGRAFAAAQLGVALTSFGAFFLLDAWPGWLEGAGWGAGRLMAAGALVSAATLLPGALCLGATFPLAVRICAGSAAEAAWATGRCLAWNTAGAIAGALAGGFLLLPALGFSRLAGLTVAASLALAATAVLATAPRCRGRAAVAGLGAIALLLVPPPTPHRLLAYSALGGAQQGERVFEGVGRSASVLVLERSDGWRLLTNGLPESLILKPTASRGALEAAGWMGLLPSLLRPEAKTMLVVGFGGGVVLEHVPASIASIEVVEIEPAVIAANRRLSGLRPRDPLADPRLQLRLEDARTRLLLSAERYDAIVSQPSHPWTSASSHLFTEEFFRLVSNRLAEDGVFVQWIGASFVNRELLASLLNTLLEVFPEVELYQPGGGPSLLLVAAKGPLESAVAARRLAGLEPAWMELGVRVPEDLIRDRRLTTAGARAFAAGAPANRDYHNLLQAEAPRLLGTAGLLGTGLDTLVPFDALFASDLAGFDRLDLLRRVLAGGQVKRAEALAAAFEKPAQAKLAQGLVALATGRRDDAERLLRDALALEPGERGALLALVLLYREALEAGRTLELETLLREDEDLAVVAALEAAGRRQWSEVAELDATLAAISPYHPLYEEAARLRVRERLARGTRDAGAQAVVLLDSALGQASAPRDRLLEAEAAWRAGDPDGALARLAALVETAERGRRAPLWLNDVERLLAHLAPAESSPIRTRIERLRSL